MERIQFTIFLATGEVTSPNYPNNYPNGHLKTETIQVGQGLVISLQFTAFDIDPSWSDPPACRYGYMTITDGDGTTLMEKSCGPTSDGNIVRGDQKTMRWVVDSSSLPPNITSTSNVVKLVFVTGSLSTTRTGWSLSWSAVTPGESQKYVRIILDNKAFLHINLIIVVEILEYILRSHKID